MHTAGQPFPGREELFAAIRAAWDSDTSADAAWTAACPSLGQCAVTALVIQDHLGGDLIRGEVDGRSHYWNVVGGEVIDLTAGQFRPGATPCAIVPRSRGYVLSFADTLRRYDLLRSRTAAIMNRTG